MGDVDASPAFVLLGALRPDPDAGRRRRRRARCSTARYVVDNYALVLKALFLLVGYVVVLLSSQTYIEEGDYYQGEYYFLLLVSVLGMVMMASARDLVSDLRRPRAALDPGLHAGGVAQARREVERGGREVLPARRVRVGA